jgi:multidrug efflux system membrane fusion protein
MIFLQHCRNIRLHTAGLAIAAVALTLFGCSGKSGAEANGRGPRAGMGGGGGAAPVVVGHVQRKIVPLVVDAIGTVEPIRSAAVRAQITGTLLKIVAHEGQDVAAGDPLVEIDSRPFENALQSALADQQRIAVQLDTARKQVTRYRSLNVGEMISQEQFQQIEDSARTLQAQAMASEAAVATAKLQLGYCSIRAPIAGRLGNFNVHEGDLIRANDTGALVTINQLSPIYVTFGVAQQHLPLITHYRAQGTLQVEAAPSAGDENVAKGELTFLDNTVDTTTGTIKLKATFANEQRHLWPGQFATITMTLAAPEVLTLPASAVQSDQSGQHVYVIKADNTAEFRPVTIERTLNDDAVVSRGLAAGETVVTDGQLRVVPGRPVQIKPAEILTNPDAEIGLAKGDTRKGKKRGT